MNEAIYDLLLNAAKQRKTLSYADVAPLACLDMSKPNDRNQIAIILDEISTHEYNLGRPLLSALVVRGGEGTPGAGFYTLAKLLGVHKDGDDVAFFAIELNLLYAAWCHPDSVPHAN